jgi:hypothetical protein
MEKDTALRFDIGDMLNQGFSSRLLYCEGVARTACSHRVFNLNIIAQNSPKVKHSKGLLEIYKES